MTALSVPARWDPARLRGRGRAHVPEAAGSARHLPGGSLVGEGLNKVGGAGHPRGSPFESVPTPRFPFQLGQPRALARAPGRPRPPGGGREPSLALSLRVRSCSVHHVGPRHALQASKWTLGLRGRRHVPAPNLPAAGGAQVGRELGRFNTRPLPMRPEVGTALEQQVLPLLKEPAKATLGEVSVCYQFGLLTFGFSQDENRLS
ncbi:unnamed protein product [Rangifer tarandus platyrhynchus]|uniref:Uncharacterized protein n=1 Tax=Rangifer tarandus platyrhynchus TaxID=3082113 RepID=A0AC60A8B1_RANTA